MIQRMQSDVCGPGQRWARAAIEVCAQVTAQGNEVTARWVPSHIGIQGNEMADRFAKEAAGGRQYEVNEDLKKEASLSHLTWVATENHRKATAQWISEHVLPERRHQVPAGSGLRCKALQQERKGLASRYYQLLSGHAATGSFLHKRMTGPLRLESSECRWCDSGATESRHHLFVECKAWFPQKQKLWRRIGKDCGWKHPKAPAVHKLWKEGATEAVLEFLRDTRVGCWAASEGGPGLPHEEQSHGF